MQDAPNHAPELDRDYQLDVVLGSGGMAVVYSATQRSLGRRVAVKVPRPELANDPEMILRFRTEARATGQLDHPNISRVIDFGGRDGELFLVLQHVAGTALDRLVIDGGAMQPCKAADLCGQILAALDEAHAAGIIHADIKSANVLVETLTSGALRAVVIDFGLARFIHEPSIHDPRWLSGTPDYLAPELIRGGAPTVASDVYATGVVLYELLTGTTPFGGGTAAEIFTRQLEDDVVPPSLRCQDQDIPIALEAVVMCALAKDPSERFASAALFGAALIEATRVLPAHGLRVVRGIPPNGFSTETTTRAWQRVVAPMPQAAAKAIETFRLQQVRLVVDQALDGGDGDSIVTSYLELARALIDGHELTAAVIELERGIEILSPRLSVGETPLAMWRLQLCLAALYSGLGDPARARAAALAGQNDAIRAASSLGADRARDLLIRLARPRALAA